jgi:dTDP-4-amino-4,6-dideoxygalactose transaminase
MHLQTVAEELDYPAGSFPVTEKQATQILAIPIYHTLTAEEIEYVAATIREFYVR